MTSIWSMRNKKRATYGNLKPFVAVLFSVGLFLLRNDPGDGVFKTVYKQDIVQHYRSESLCKIGKKVQEQNSRIQGISKSDNTYYCH